MVRFVAKIDLKVTEGFAKIKSQSYKNFLINSKTSVSFETSHFLSFCFDLKQLGCLSYSNVYLADEANTIIRFVCFHGRRNITKMMFLSLGNARIIWRNFNNSIFKPKLAIFDFICDDL